MDNGMLNREELDDLSEEERKEYLKHIMEQPMLQGLVMAPMPPGQPIGMMPGMLGAVQAFWIDETVWKCICGIENGGKFCTECGRAAPPKEWTCPTCGSVGNKGRFCGECGSKRPET